MAVNFFTCYILKQSYLRIKIGTHLLIKINFDESCSNRRERRAIFAQKRDVPAFCAAVLPVGTKAKPEWHWWCFSERRPWMRHRVLCFSCATSLNADRVFGFSNRRCEPAPYLGLSVPIFWRRRLDAAVKTRPPFSSLLLTRLSADSRFLRSRGSAAGHSGQSTRCCPVADWW